MQFPTHESETVEFKLSLSDTSSIAHSLCAFANTQGGVLYVGIEKSGVPAGVKGSRDDLQRKLSDIVLRLKPAPFHSITVLEHGYYAVLAVSVKALEREICFYDGKAWMRSGTTTRILEGVELIRFARERTIVSFEDGSPSATIKDIDMQKVGHYFMLRGLPVPALPSQDILRNLKLVSGITLTNLAILLFAKDISRFMPQSSIKMVKFKGIAPVEIINADHVTGTVIEIISRALSFIKANTRTTYEITGTQRIEKEEYPDVACREAIVNAVGHRDYFDQNHIQVSIFDDRIEITNPGKLMSGISIQDLGKIAKHRNPHLYEVLMGARLVEGFGTGIPRMISQMRARGHADPKFEEIGDMFRVILYNSRGTVFATLNPLEKKVFSMLQNETVSTATALALGASVSTTTAISILRKLEDAGYVEKTGRTRGSKFIFLS